MTLELISLRKLVQLFYLPENRRVSALREDIRSEINAEHSDGGGGGHFHLPFWAAAKGHVIDEVDLVPAVQAMIDANGRRARLYPLLRDGFLLYFNERRRWTNAPFRNAVAPHARLAIDGGTTIKIEHLLAVSDAAGVTHYVYPYFAEYPVLGEEGARLILWALTTAFPGLPADELRVLDVLRGSPFSTDRNPLAGNEEHIFVSRLAELRRLRQELRREY